MAWMLKEVELSAVKWKDLHPQRGKKRIGKSIAVEMLRATDLLQAVSLDMGWNGPSKVLSLHKSLWGVRRPRTIED